MLYTKIDYVFFVWFIFEYVSFLLLIHATIAKTVGIVNVKAQLFTSFPSYDIIPKPRTPADKRAFGKYF